MNFLRKIASISFLAVALLFVCSSYGLCSPTYQITEEQLTTLETNLAQLEKNNQELRNLLNQSNLNLTQAGEQSIILRNQIETLNEQLIESQKQIQELRNHLIEAQKSTSVAQNSLETANRELAKAGESFKKLGKQRKSLEFKNKILKVAVLGLIGVIAIRG
jgi:Alpha helical coiled-coil rod protein (HCR).